MQDKTEMVTYAEAWGAAVREEMRRDERVVVWGIDVSRGRLFTGTPGILEEFGEKRVRNTPIAEQAFVSMAIGAALTGLRPVVFLGGSGFVAEAFCSLFLNLGNYWQLLNYKGGVPVVIHSSIGGGRGASADHCLAPEALLIHSPGLKVVMPSTPYDAKGLMKAAIRDDYPVIYLTHGLISGTKQAIPSGEYVVPLGKADVKREGKDVTIVAYSEMVVRALAAAEALSKEGVSVELVDLRSLAPMDIETVVKSVRKTSRLLIVHEAMKRGGAAAEIAFRVTEAAPDVVKSLKAPIGRLAAKNIALPHGVRLESMVVPQVDDIVKAVKEII